MEKRETVGKLSHDLQLKESDSQDPIELQRSLQDGFEDEMVKAIERGKKEFTGSFYVVVLTKRERLMENVLRDYFVTRQSCPTPEYDQAVYRIHRNPEAVEFLWVVPCKEACQHLRLNALEVVLDERWLLEYVLAFYDGRLYTWALQLNNEICTKESVCQTCKPIKNALNTTNQPTLTKSSTTNKNQIILT